MERPPNVGWEPRFVAWSTNVEVMGDDKTESRNDRSGVAGLCWLCERAFTVAALIKAAAQKAVLQRQINSTDAEIDRLVYELYGLTEEEIAVIEGTTPSEPRQ